MSEQTTKIEVSPSGETLNIRTGDTYPVANFRKGVDVKGNIDTPRVHLTNPPNQLTGKIISTVKPSENNDTVLAFSFLQVNREAMKLEFVEDAGNQWRNTYIGQLEFSEIFQKFGINSGKEYTTLELGEFIKMNRSHFEKKSDAMALVTQLRQFKAKVNKDVENHDDSRGNKKILLAQAVDSNIPENFKINIPVFKGQDKQLIEVEISINAGDLSCSLISPEANDYIEETRDRLINSEVDQIKVLHPTLRIFEV